MKVVKFGGTSVANAARINKVIAIVKEQAQQENTVVVVSAFGGITDSLLEALNLAHDGNASYLQTILEIKARHLTIAKELKVATTIVLKLETKFQELENHVRGVYFLQEVSNKTKDKVLSFGELLSSLIISEALKKEIPEALLKDSRELIVTNEAYSQAVVLKDLTRQKIKEEFASINSSVVLVPGFVSKSVSGHTTTLGRGGSDYTAAIMAAVLNANILEIWTDVSGVYTANPKLVKQAYPIKELSYKEAMELSHFGAKVIYPPTIQPVLKKEIPTRIKNTFKPEDEGTLIIKNPRAKNGPVKGISYVDGIALLTLEGNGMLGVPGFAIRMFSVLSRESINVVIITQASSEHSICIGVYQQDVKKAQELIDEEFAYEISLNKIKPLEVETNLAIVAVVGDSMKNHQGISGKTFSSLGKNNINVRAIAQGASERNISAVISSTDVKKALTSLHNRFFEKQIKTLNLFVVGVGNVGGILLEQIQQQQNYLKEHLLLNLKVIGISNSKKMVFNGSGIDLNNWKNLLAKGEDKTHQTFFEKVKNFNLSHSIFIDITASNEVATTYNKYLTQSISVIACNKIACSSAYKNYKELKLLSKKYGASFLFETNVGAGLPIINTLQNLINSGDTILSIQAVLSGSLNFIFNQFKEDSSFYQVVKHAQEEGYTEPDPRIDLSGVDVARKILILARESGYKLNLDDVVNQSFLPKESLEAGSVDKFYASLQTNASHFNELYQSAKERGCRLKYVAEFTNGKASVGLKEIDSTHPFYNLEGKDNIVLFFTSRYPEQPLIVKGAGAGAQVTASGLFGDIITLGKN